MPTRTSTRQAAAKANEALHQGAKAGTKRTAGSKRKATEQDKSSKPKRERNEDEITTELEEPKPEGAKEQPPATKHEKESEIINGEPEVSKKRIDGMKVENGEEAKEPGTAEHDKAPDTTEEPKEAEKKDEINEPENMTGIPEPEKIKEPKAPEVVEQLKEPEKMEGIKESDREMEAKEHLEREEEPREEPRDEPEAPTPAASEKPQPNQDEAAEPETKEKTSEPNAGKAAGESRDLPSNVLEKGIIYFFFRGKVSVEEPESIDEVARSFIVLRPLPRDAKLDEGPIGAGEHCRLLVLPKKVLPKSSRDKFMGFVEKGHSSAKEIRDSFRVAEKETVTRGTTHSPAATPVAEGVYAITTRDRAAHLVYHLTVPSELSEVQKNIGLKPCGSFIATAKNPKYPGTAWLPNPPEYPQKVREEFGDLRWVPLRPEFLDYPNAQFLLIGGTHHELGTEEAGRVIETLEHENELRVSPLSNDDAIYQDLGMNSRNYPKVATTWE
ncbi:hypothetical protein PAAG_08360 [Paracoccidioides lutzii Pb01]|uniref:BTB domain transcription factor n=1 Tax=Paracoccidioides lutzii (strain ATCC MYA-826 / Pb01) TaxID=502779 RepID=C1HC69_PARBA|nr:hypothetical protein PAAG_08360 [Paracoccidioides lutzii Pb01]EEH38633.2 hypothetical protein PAAG_08360 [Paracoccidioides lutzii Pb01]